jgi:hypothetical protein
MFLAFRPLAKAGALVCAALLTVSSASAQPSGLGHVAAPGFRPVYSPGGSTFQVYPGDKGFHSTMQIQRYYQTLARMRTSEPTPSVTRPRSNAAPAAETASSVVVTISEPANRPVLVDIRGPDGKLRSFALAGGREAIQPQTIVVHPGEKLTIQFNGAHVQLNKKP